MSRFGRRGDVRVRPARVVREELVEVGLVEAVVVAEEGVLPREGGVVLDGEVVLVDVVEVEGAGEGVRGGEERDGADGGGEVCADVEAGGQARGEVGKGVAPAGVRDEVVIGAGVEAWTGGANVRGSGRGPLGESGVGGVRWGGLGIGDGSGGAWVEEPWVGGCK